MLRNMAQPAKGSTFATVPILTLRCLSAHYRHLVHCLWLPLQVLDFEDHNMGYDAATNQYRDMVKAGIIDPLKVRVVCAHMG